MMNIKLSPRYISGFDYLRCFFAILVVILHADGASFLVRINSNLQDFVNIFEYNACLLAVPVFFSISLFLFYQKQLTNPNFFPKKRMKVLLRIYGIWMLIGIVFNLLSSQGKYIFKILDLENLIITIVRGSRPELFFLFSLIVITYLGFLNSKYFLSKKRMWIQLYLFLVSILIITLASFSTLVTQKATLSAYWNPICFIPYIFSSSILLIIYEGSKSNLGIYFYRKRFLFILTLFSIFVLMSYLEWQFLNVPSVLNNYLLPPYARPSCVIGSFLICYCAILYNTQPPRLIYRLSQESLGIYLLHIYVLFFIRAVISSLKNLQDIHSINLLLDTVFDPILIAAYTVIICVLFSKLLKQYKIGQLMLNSSSK